MTGLADILPSVETVEIRGRKIDVSGIDLPDILPLLKRFPSISQLFLGNVFDETLLTQSKEIAAAFIAAGCGKAGDEDEERGRDVGPFVEVIIAMGFGQKPAPTGSPAPAPSVPTSIRPDELPRSMKRSRPQSSPSEQSDGLSLS